MELPLGQGLPRATGEVGREDHGFLHRPGDYRTIFAIFFCCFLTGLFGQLMYPSTQKSSYEGAPWHHGWQPGGGVVGGSLERCQCHAGDQKKGGGRRTGRPSDFETSKKLRIQKKAMHAYLYWMAAPSRWGSPGSLWKRAKWVGRDLEQKSRLKIWRDNVKRRKAWNPKLLEMLWSAKKNLDRNTLRGKDPLTLQERGWDEREGLKQKERSNESEWDFRQHETVWSKSTGFRLYYTVLL